MRLVGTSTKGIRAPIIREGDDLVDFVVSAVLEAKKAEGFSLHDKDVVCLTEAIVARSQGNYASVDDIAHDIQKKYPDGEIGVFNPILSRNRFAINLRGIARGAKKIILQLTYPNDEVGNALISIDQIDEAGINPWSDVLTEEDFRKHFGSFVHPFTGVDYINYYREIIEEEGCEVEIIFANQATEILKHTKHVLTCDIHTRKRTKRILTKAGAETVYNLEDILNESIDGSGYNENYGLLGSNKASEEKVKLFPRNCQSYVEQIAEKLLIETGKYIEVMVYGDGAFKDPVGKIWELADPVVSPAYTEGLSGLPNEIKLKYLADNDFADLSGQELNDAMKKAILEKGADLKGNKASTGTTPRQITDLIGSLADLTSGSGDKGTPIVLVQGYFDNWTSADE